MLKRERKINAYIAGNGDTSDKSEPNHMNISFPQSSKTRWRFPLLYCFFDLPKALHRVRVHIFGPKNISLLVPLESVCKKGI